MRPLDLGAPVPSDFVEPRCVSIATTAHLLGVRKRQVWEWIIEGSLRHGHARPAHGHLHEHRGFDPQLRGDAASDSARGIRAAWNKRRILNGRHS